jgi:hypothetical protein
MFTSEGNRLRRIESGQRWPASRDLNSLGVNAWLVIEYTPGLVYLIWELRNTHLVANDEIKQVLDGKFLPILNIAIAGLAILQDPEEI